MRTRWTAVVGVILAFFTVGAFGAAAQATAPVTMDSGFVTDAAGVLSSDEKADVQQALDDLTTKTGDAFYVVLVDEFSDPSDKADWAYATAVENGIGVDQVLVAIATDQNTYAIDVDNRSSVSDSRIEAFEDGMLPDGRNGDWAAAIIAGAEAAQGSGGGFLTGFLIFAAIVAVIVLAIVLISRSRKRQHAVAPAQNGNQPQDPFAGTSDEELATQAGSALVHADDAITSSREELGFASAQFGDDALARFSKTVEAAQEKIAAAFSLKQQLDDEVPDTDEQRRAWHIQIIQLCDEADDLLDDNIEAFDALRELEKNAPQALEAVKSKRSEVATALPQAPTALQQLSSAYEPAALSTVAENPQHAQERLSLADSEIAEAETALAAGKNGEAAFAIRTAEEALIQATQLLGAITQLGSSLATIESQAKALIADLEADLAAAAQLPDSQGQLASVVASTRTHVDEAQRNLQGQARNPERVLATLTAANTQIDALIGQSRDAAQRQERSRQTLGSYLTQAQTQISVATDFISTRRGAVGAEARTRLAEAQATLSQALAVQSNDPEQAVALASRAHSLAQQAISAAENDLSGWNGGGGYGGGGGLFGGGGGNLAGDILGGILGGIISSAGRSSGGGWRSSGGGGRSYRPSGFGGGGGRSRGGRSRGGRF